MKKTLRKLISAIIAVICISLLPVSVLAVHETESNDDFELATVINVNETNTGVTNDDADFYKFTLDTDGYIEIEAYHNYGSIAQYITLYNVNRKCINDVSFEDRSEKAPLVKVGLSKGTYYVQFFCDSFNRPSYNYSFKIKFTPSDCWEKEFNGNVTKATLINIGTKYYGTYTCSDLDDSDYYKFTVKEDSWVSFTYRRSRGVLDDFISIRTYDLTREKYLKSFTVKSNSEKVTEKIYLKKGEYYFCVERQVFDGQTPEYNFILNYEKAEITSVKTTTTTTTTTTITTQNHKFDNTINAYVQEDTRKSTIVSNNFSQNKEQTAISDSVTEDNNLYENPAEITDNYVDDGPDCIDYPIEPDPSTDKTEHNYKQLFIITIVVAVLIISVLILYFTCYKPKKH